MKPTTLLAASLLAAFALPASAGSFYDFRGDRATGGNFNYDPPTIWPRSRADASAASPTHLEHLRASGDYRWQSPVGGNAQSGPGANGAYAGGTMAPPSDPNGTWQNPSGGNARSGRGAVGRYAND